MTRMLRQIELCTGVPADIAQVERVMAEAFDPRFGEAWTRGQCLGVLGMPGVWMTLARVEGVICGFALGRAIMDEAELLLLAVDPKARRRGVGGALLRSVIAEARGRGVNRLHLEVREGNGAIALYRGAGFAKVGERRGYYRVTGGRAIDAHTYSVDL